LPASCIDGEKIVALKRILSLDGGGIRGVFSLQIAARIEELFRQEHGRKDLVLADVFDLFAGTSTGAIIAAFLAWGAPVEEIERHYVQRGSEMFARERWFRRWRCKYRAESIADFFRTHFCESPGQPALLGSSRLKKLLLVVMRNASTGSPWPISSNPYGLFNDCSRDDCNLNIPIWQLLRASTAAPSFFPPEQITFGSARHLFVDGGVTPFNNPSLLAVMMATLPCYRLNWPATRESLHVVSIGTGSFLVRLPHKLAEKIHLVDQLKFVIPALIGSIATEQDTICRLLGDCLHGAPIDTEIGDLMDDSLLAPQERKFTYVRYDQQFDVAPQSASSHPLISHALDDLRLIPALQQAGREYAAAHVKREHLFPGSV
jgi:hypothetical protein